MALAARKVKSVERTLVSGIPALKLTRLLVPRSRQSMLYWVECWVLLLGILLCNIICLFLSLFFSALCSLFFFNLFSIYVGGARVPPI